MSSSWDIGSPVDSILSAITRASHALNAAGVETPTCGTATTHHVFGKSGIATTCSPRPDPITAPPSRNKGTSDPISAANSSLSSLANSTPNSRSNPNSAAAAFADPAPTPPCTGNFFSMWIATSAVTPSRPKHRSTIRQAVFRASRGTKGWFVVNEIRVSATRFAETVTRSYKSSVW